MGFGQQRKDVTGRFQKTFGNKKIRVQLHVGRVCTCVLGHGKEYVDELTGEHIYVVNLPQAVNGTLGIAQEAAVKIQATSYFWMLV